MEQNAKVRSFFHEGTNTISYIVHDGKEAAVIDPVLGFNHRSGHTDTTHADDIIAALKEQNLKVRWILETHAHADHLTAAPYIKKAVGGHIAIGENITKVQEVFAEVFNDKEILENRHPAFDKTFTDGEGFKIGTLEARYIHTPGHTPACGMYVIGNNAFVGDTIFMPDAGTARCDFPGGCAKTLYKSITEKIFALPDDTTLYMCHDYGADGTREIAWQTTVGEEKAKNIHVGGEKTMAEFVEMRTKRDAGLDLPLLIIPSVQVNIRGGKMPNREDNGVRYVKVPLNKM